jgi:hypothetical protein
MGYKTQVILYDDKINIDKVFELILDARKIFRIWDTGIFTKDYCKVVKTKNGYRITKQYEIEPIYRPLLEVEQ